MTYNNEDKKKCIDYRGILLTSVLSRVYEKILNLNVEEEQQSGFKAGGMCRDNVFHLKQLIENKEIQIRIEIHLMFIDLRKGYILQLRHHRMKSSSRNEHKFCIEKVPGKLEPWFLSESGELASGMLGFSHCLEDIHLKGVPLKRKYWRIGVDLDGIFLYFLQIVNDPVSPCNR